MLLGTEAVCVHTDHRDAGCGSVDADEPYIRCLLLGPAVHGTAPRCILLLMAVIVPSGVACGSVENCRHCVPAASLTGKYFTLSLFPNGIPTGIAPSGTQEGEACRLSCILSGIGLYAAG